MNTITTSGESGLRLGDSITFWEPKPWWVRLWRWITRYKAPVFIVTSVTGTVMTVAIKTTLAERND